MAGINKLMEVLATMGVDEPTRRGQVMTYFYKQLHRRPGEDLNAWMIRFGEVRSQLDEEDVDVAIRSVRTTKRAYVLYLLTHKNKPPKPEPYGRFVLLRRPEPHTNLSDMVTILMKRMPM